MTTPQRPSWKGNGAGILEAPLTSWKAWLFFLDIALRKAPKKSATRSPSGKGCRLRCSSFTLNLAPILTTQRPSQEGKNANATKKSWKAWLCLLAIALRKAPKKFLLGEKGVLKAWACRSYRS